MGFKISSFFTIPVLVGLLSSSAGADSALELKKFLFEGNHAIHTDAFIVMKDGKTLFESYGRGFSRSSKHRSWSMAKTFGGILIAQAIDQGYLKLDDPIRKWIPSARTSATVADVLAMSSGLRFREEYSGIPVNSDATRMLYLTGPRTGFAKYAASRPELEDAEPGHYFAYSSGDANLLMEVLRESVRDDAKYGELPWNHLFIPLGIPNATFERDATGTFVASSYVYMTPADYARVGQMLVNRGRVAGKQVVPSWYFARMIRVAPGVKENSMPGTDPERAYSSQITTNLPIPSRGLLSQYPDLPEDALILIGHQGNLVIASPSQKLVLVRLAMDEKDDIDRQMMFARVKAFLSERGRKITTPRDVHPDAYRAYVRPLRSKAEGELSLTDYLRVPHLIRALAAKEMCSCLFVTRRTHAECKTDLKTMLPVLPRFEYEASTAVLRTRLGIGFKASRAHFINERFGCTLEVSE